MKSAQIEKIRSFNRTFTRRIGALNDSFLGRGRPLTEARLVYEIGRDGAELRELRSRLSLDSGFLSRLLRSLENQGLVESQRAADDARARRVTLTRQGRLEINELERRADAFAATLLDPLSATKRDRLATAVAEVEHLMQASAVAITAEPAGSEAARWCLRHYFQELAQRFDTGFDAADSIAATPDQLTPPQGLFLVARLDGQPIGCGAMKVKDNSLGEIKRMWVAESARGLGVGRRVLENLEQHARQLGLRVLRLETNKALIEAQALYRQRGYREVGRFNDEPYAHHWFQKDLSVACTGSDSVGVAESRNDRVDGSE